MTKITSMPMQKLQRKLKVLSEDLDNMPTCPQELESIKSSLEEMVLELKQFKQELQSYPCNNPGKAA